MRGHVRFQRSLGEDRQPGFSRLFDIAVVNRRATRSAFFFFGTRQPDVARFALFDLGSANLKTFDPSLDVTHRNEKALVKRMRGAVLLTNPFADVQPPTLALSKKTRNATQVLFLFLEMFHYFIERRGGRDGSVLVLFDRRITAASPDQVPAVAIVQSQRAQEAVVYLVAPAYVGSLILC